VPQHAICRDAVAADNVGRKPLRRAHLGLGKIQIAQLMARIVDLNADGARVEVGLAGPMRHARVPGAHAFGNHLRYAAVAADHVVAGDLALGVRQPFDSLLGAVHAGVVQDQHVGPVAILARLDVGRRVHGIDDGCIGLDDHAAHFRWFGGSRGSLAAPHRRRPSGVVLRPAAISA
jgi:hypothetical protein